jgi:acyl-CoA thioesterase I
MSRFRRARVSAAWRPYAAAVALVQAALLVGACDTREARVNEQQAGGERPDPVPAVPVSGPKRLVLAFGDSLYAGYGLGRGESLPDAIGRRLRATGIDAEIVNAGVSGDTTAGGLRRLAYTLDRLGRTPDLVVLGLGGNDVLRQVDPAETRANLDAMLGMVRKRGIPVILTGMLAPPNLGPDYAARFNAVWPDLARKHGAVLDPFILQGVIGNRALLLPDGVHPNARGVERMADRLAPVVARRLAEPDPG